MSLRALSLAVLLAVASAAQAATPAATPHHGPHHSLLHFFLHLGLVGLFLVAVVDSSFVPFPIPGVTDIMLVLYAAGSYNPILLVAIATLGSAIGGLVSHMAGQAGGMKFLEKHVPRGILTRITTWMEEHAILSVSLPAILPPPMPLSPFVLAAGAVHMSRKKFMWAFTISRCLRHCIAVWLGIRYGHAVLHLWTRFSAKWATSILIALWSIILLFTAIAIWKLYKTSSATIKLQPGKRTSPGAATAP
jgi:membrane protein YqaA with SNARE-associated domain